VPVLLLALSCDELPPRLCSPLSLLDLVLLRVGLILSPPSLSFWINFSVSSGSLSVRCLVELCAASDSCSADNDGARDGAEAVALIATMYASLIRHRCKISLSLNDCENEHYICPFCLQRTRGTFPSRRLAPVRAGVCGHLPLMRIIGSPATLLMFKVLGSHNSVSGRLRLITC
jgi:hypothetical protein